MEKKDVQNSILGLVVGALLTQGVNMYVAKLESDQQIAKINANKEIEIERIRAGSPNNSREFADTTTMAKSIK